ncbi:carotenoid ester lipase precursor [Gymnopilus junonius]|uniref:Carboxylic ester hydrolase n=1 Tax=Gymnopilus junonius TaxID=109634 RepID=A0A9P5NXW0_GYMJU|nr:carotenoid ester lipase precursor [Gymnopilus junonius]
MLKGSRLLSWLCLLLPSFRIANGAALVGPVVELDSGTFTGISVGGVSQFLGIPYAQPPVGDLRLRLPQPNSPYNGSHLATTFGLACPQQQTGLPLPPGLASQTIDLITNLGIDAIFPDSEDCLTINVVTPSTTTSKSKLPVVLWIYGGGFERGTASFPLYDGSVIVERSILLGMPIVYASINYRINGFGFLASKEVKAAGVGNLGLQDQRQAMRWIQKYISAFGGDPTKVTIWGESAGAISVALQLVANGGNNEGLFRAAFMQSGSAMPLGEITEGQPLYDMIVQETGCEGSADTLECIRQLPVDVFKAAINKAPGIFDFQSLNLAWPARADGVFLTDHPQKLVQQGIIANVPFVSGDCDDEGTLFSFSTLNVTTDAEFVDYVQNTLLQGIGVTDDEMTQLASLYPDNPTQGSPFNTGVTNALTPQFKRLASFQGDLVFQAPRRFLLQNRSGKQTVFAFLSQRFKTTPTLGSFHVTDLLNVYGGEELTNYLVRFVTTLNPNGFGNVMWPQYTPQSPQMLTFLDGLIPTTITLDTFRSSQLAFLNNLTLAHPL